VWAGLPNNNYNAASDSFRLTLKTQGRNYCAAVGADFIDFEAIAGTGAVPNRMVSAYDAVHPKNDLQDLMAAVLRDYLLTA
jgi:hypothetical protein